MADETVTEIASEELEGFGPAIDEATMHEMEKGAASDDRGITRRLALLAMVRSAEQLGKMSLDEPKTYAQIREHVESFKDHAQALLEVANAAVLRMKICDFSLDVTEVFKDSEASGEVSA